MSEHNTSRTVPMKVLCLGFGRTGTISLREALLTLGYRHAYHTFDAVMGNTYDCKLWTDMINAKLAGNPPGRADFDRILGHCQAVLDMPAAYFVKELLEAYPDAKVILTERDYESWYKSVKSTLRTYAESSLTPLLAMADNALFMPTRYMHRMFRAIDRALYDSDFERNNKRAYEEHNARVKALVAPERLLVYHPGDGWEPLCEFLGRPVPEEGVFFNVNSGAEFNRMTREMNRVLVMAQVKRVLDVLAYASLTGMVVGGVLRRFPGVRRMVGW